MRIRFSAPNVDGPRVISEIPDFRLCRLEGENGIGKTLAARLLELATGGNPYAASRDAWRALREQLGTVQIVVDRLDNGRELVYTLDPRSWPDDPAQIGRVGSIGSVAENGKELSSDDAARIFRAFRVGGDETLQRAVAAEVSMRAGRARRVLESLAPRRLMWDASLQEYQDITEGLSPGSLEERRERVAAAQRAADAARLDIETMVGVEAILEKLRASAAAAARLARTAASTIDDIRRLRREAVANDRELADTDQQLGRLASRLEAGVAAREQLEDLERLRAGRMKRFADDESVERSYLRSLGLDRRPDRAALSQANSDAKAQLVAAEGELERLDLITPLAQTAIAVESTLATAVGRIGDGVVVARPPLTVRELLSGVRQRRVELEGEPRPGEVDRLRDEVERLRRRLQYLANLAASMRATDRKKALLDDVEGRIERLLASLAGAGVEAYRELQERRNEIRILQVDRDRQLSDALSTLGDLVRTAGVPGEVDAIIERGAIPDATLLGGTLLLIEALPDDREERLNAAIEAAGAQPEIRLEAASEWSQVELGTIATDVISARTSLADAREAQARADAELVALRHQLRDAVETLAGTRGSLKSAVDAVSSRLTGSVTEALRSNLPPVTPDAPIPPTEMAAARVCAAVHAASALLTEATSEIVNATGTLLSYLVAQAERLGASRQSGEDQLLVENITGAAGLRRWVEVDIASMFSSAELRAELFDDSAEVSFDLERRVFEWTVDHRLRQRPLEAFSSGEQVFAYTKAKLVTLRQQAEGTEHILAILDEFGAFVSRDRLGHLLRFVELDALGTLAEQVVVMLPLTSLVGIAPGARRPFDAQLPEAEQVASFRYFVRDETRETTAASRG
jgi:hypothetical protein